jgi:ribonuclease HI
MAKIQVNTDGGSRGNPGPAAVGVVITREGELVMEKGRTIGSTTNNQAEYQALAWAVELLDGVALAGDEVEFVLDSQLVERQMRGVYKVKDAGLYEWRQKIITDLARVPWKFSFRSVLREQNKAADRMVNAALDGQI